MVADKKAIGLPVRQVESLEQATDWKQIVEKWPLIQAYGLDLVGEGFFTMKHSVINITEQLN